MVLTFKKTKISRRTQRLELLRLLEREHREKVELSIRRHDSEHCAVCNIVLKLKTGEKI